MPNIHNLAFPLEKYGLKNQDHTGNPTIFYPIDEPHGMIKVSALQTFFLLKLFHLILGLLRIVTPISFRRRCPARPPNCKPSCEARTCWIGEEMV
jgi:hypothetical protein